MREPPCPITGAAPVRHVQVVSPTLLKDLWRIEFKVDVTSSFRNVERIDLWESPTGLYYFDPPMEGDAQFYNDYYRSLQRGGHYSPGTLREQFRMVACEIGRGESVLDVGSGYGGLRTLLTEARYVGLDRNFSEEVEWARNESLEEHLVSHAEEYDAACLFEVIEHLAAPAAMMRNMARAVRPGGRVFISAPHVPSAMTRIPNFLLNAPPHHLSWWTERALRAAAEQAGLVVQKIEPIPWCSTTSKIYWIERCTPLKTRGIYFRHSWPMHISAIVGAGLGLVMNTLMGPPKGMVDEGAGLLMTASKPT